MARDNYFFHLLQHKNMYMYIESDGFDPPPTLHIYFGNVIWRVIKYFKSFSLFRHC